MITPRVERLALALVPALALALVAVGLYTGATGRMVGARVYAATPGLGRPGLSLQLMTVAEESGVPEVVALPSVSVTAQAHGREARWHGASSSAGVAEAWLDLDRLQPGDRVELAVSTDDGARLAAGAFRVPGAGAEETDPSSAIVRPQRAAGPLVVDVYLYGATLVPNEVTLAVVRVRDRLTGQPVGGVTVVAEAEQGLEIVRPFGRTAEGGWATAAVRADFLIAAWTLSATTTEASPREGSWHGALPVTPGGATVDLPPRLAPDAPHALAIRVPAATPRVYVDVRDTAGRDFGVALDVAPPRDGRATEVTVPALSPGLYWLVTSLDPHDAETLSGTSVARPFRVGPVSDSDDAIAQRAELARLVAPRAPRPMVLDGFVPLRRKATAARRRGMALALGAVLLGTLLEVCLILRAAQRTRERMRLATEAAQDAGGDPLEAPPDRRRATVYVIVLILATLLGFALVGLPLLVPLE